VHFTVREKGRLSIGYWGITLAGEGEVGERDTERENLWGLNHVAREKRGAVACAREDRLRALEKLIKRAGKREEPAVVQNRGSQGWGVAENFHNLWCCRVWGEMGGWGSKRETGRDRLFLEGVAEGGVS